MFDTGFGAKAALFHALGAELAAAITHDLTGAVAVAVLPEILAGVRQGELATVRLIERADRSGDYAADGAASVTAYVRTTANENSNWASRRVHVGRALADMLPATAKAFQAGGLGLEHAAVIDTATKKLEADLAAAMDVFLAELAPTMTPKELAAAAEDLRAQAAPEESAKETAKKRAAQSLHLSQTMDGMWRLDGWLDAENGLTVSTAIAQFLRKAMVGGDLLTESLSRRRADALVDVCRQAITHHETCHSPGLSRHTIIVGLTHQQLLDGLGTAGISGAGNLPAATARRMACDANIIPAVYGGNSEIVDYGRSMRTVSAGLHRVLNTRDGGCTFTHCDRPPSSTETHHRICWESQSGPTKDTNLELSFPRGLGGLHALFSGRAEGAIHAAQSEVPVGGPGPGRGNRRDDWQVGRERRARTWPQSRDAAQVGEEVAGARRQSGGRTRFAGRELARAQAAA
jgi:Domain of unknown function (DUF222)